MRTSMVICLICGLVGCVIITPRETVLFDAESAAGVTLSWGEDNPGSRIELNSDMRFVSRGRRSLCVRSLADESFRRTVFTYVGFQVEVPPTRLDGEALAVDLWTSTPDLTDAVWVRGHDRDGRKVIGWRAAGTVLSPDGHTLTLVPGRSSPNVTPETTADVDRDIVAVEVLVGSRADRGEFDFYVDNIRVTAAPEMPPENHVDHGVMAPAGSGSLAQAALDHAGRRIIFSALDVSGTRSFLFIDAETGETDQVVPDLSPAGISTATELPEDAVFTTIGMALVAIDIPARTVHYLGRLPASGLVLAITRADDGILYMGIYPTATLVSYDPATRTMTHHGNLNSESWPQYLRPLGTDSAGWVYGGIAMERMQIVGFHPATGEIRTFVPEEQRQRGYIPNLYRGTDGSVYARADRFQFGSVREIHEDGWGWHRLYDGKATPIDEPPVGGVRRGGPTFPDGSRYSGLNIADRGFLLHDAEDEEPREVRFDYASSGIGIYCLTTGPDGKIYGSTGNPLRFWCYDPESGVRWDAALPRTISGGHVNQMVSMGDRLYGAVYSSARLIAFDPSKPYDDSGESGNPRSLHVAEEAFDLYGRPRAVLAHSDGRHILVGGNAARVLLGSGMLIFDTETGDGTILDRTDLIVDHGINALVALPDGDVLVGTTIRPPTAGQRGTAETAMIYRFSMADRSVTGKWLLEPDTDAVSDMVVGGDGLVYGLADPNRFFVFDPRRNVFAHRETVVDYGTTTGHQAPRAMAVGPDGKVYAVFRNAVVRIETGTFAHEAIAWPPVPITVGIAIQDDRLYFGSGPRLWSCAIPTE